MTKSVKPIVARPNLEFDRKQAKALLASLQDAQPEALARFQNHHPRQVPSIPKLADAQLVIAREYGFSSWPQWKVFVETRNLNRKRQAEIALKASCSSDLARARTLCNADPELAREDPYLACACGEVDTVRKQLQQDPGWATQPGGINGWEPLLYACFSRWLRADATRAHGITQIVEILLHAGADANAVYQDPENGAQTALYGAAGISNNPHITRLLLEAGADVDEGHPAADPADPSASPWGTEALYHACEFRDSTCLELLLAAKPDRTRVSYCMYRAMDHDNIPAVQAFLRAGADPNLSVPHLGAGNSLHFAILRKCSAELVQLLLQAGADVHSQNGADATPYGRAVQFGRQDLAQSFLAHGAQASEATEEDQLLGQAMQGTLVAPGRITDIPPQLLCEAARTNNVPAIHALLNAGADVNAAGHDNFPPLHQAAWRAQLDAVQALVERDADILQRNGYGSHALGTAIHGSENCFDVDGGPAMKLPEEAHDGPYPEVVEHLLALGAPLPESIWGGSAAVREVLRQHGVPDV